MLKVLNLDEKGKNVREMVNDAVLSEIKNKAAGAGDGLRANQMLRLSSWCKTYNDCDLAGLRRNRP